MRICTCVYCKSSQAAMSHLELKTDQRGRQQSSGANMPSVAPSNTASSRGDLGPNSTLASLPTIESYREFLANQLITLAALRRSRAIAEQLEPQNDTPPRPHSQPRSRSQRAQRRIRSGKPLLPKPTPADHASHHHPPAQQVSPSQAARPLSQPAPLYLSTTSAPHDFQPKTSRQDKHAEEHPVSGVQLQHAGGPGESVLPRTRR
jgi:hypothetical protein